MRKQEKGATGGSTDADSGSGDKDVTHATATMGEKEPSTAADSAKTNLLVLNEASLKLIFFQPSHFNQLI